MWFLRHAAGMSDSEIDGPGSYTVKLHMGQELLQNSNSWEHSRLLEKKSNMKNLWVLIWGDCSLPLSTQMLISIFPLIYMLY